MEAEGWDYAIRIKGYPKLHEQVAFLSRRPPGRPTNQVVRRFEHFQQRLGVTRHVLADRLRKREYADVRRREKFQDRPERHEHRLTDAGLDLYPVLVSLIKWANANVPSDAPAQTRLYSRATGEPLKPHLIDAAAGEIITPHTVTATKG